MGLSSHGTVKDVWLSHGVFTYREFLLRATSTVLLLISEALLTKITSIREHGNQNFLFKVGADLSAGEIWMACGSDALRIR